MTSKPAAIALCDRSLIRAFFLEPVVGELRRLGLLTEQVLGDHDVTLDDLASPYRWIPLRTHIGLMEDAAKVTCNDLVGLDLGSGFSQQMLGPFAALLQSARTLGDAFEFLRTFQHAWQANTTFVVERGEELTYFLYVINDAKIWPRRQDAEFTLAALVSMVRELGLPRWHPEAVEFEHALPRGCDRLTSFFGAPVRGGMLVNRITVRTEELDRPLRNGGEHLPKDFAKTLSRHLLDLMHNDDDAGSNISEVVAASIDRRLGHSLMTIETVARDLNMSPRSLRRKLDDAGTSFRAILQERRHAKAEMLLSSQAIQTAELAEQLGYSDAAVFSRAFKEWTGLSPRQFADRRAVH